MVALLDAREDGKAVTLCFVSKADAEQFKQFVGTYMEESGAGNGYSAYWVYLDAPIIQADAIPPRCVTKLNDELISAMRNAIVGARLAGDDQEGGGIMFWSQELPPRQRPTCGDMFRALVSQGAQDRMEGRVVADHGETLEVISWQEEDEEGKPISGARIVTIPASQTMKICDWRAARKA